MEILYQEKPKVDEKQWQLMVPTVAENIKYLLNITDNLIKENVKVQKFNHELYEQQQQQKQTNEILQMNNQTLLNKIKVNTDIHTSKIESLFQYCNKFEDKFSNVQTMFDQQIAQLHAELEEFQTKTKEEVATTLQTKSKQIDANLYHINQNINAQLASFSHQMIQSKQEAIQLKEENQQIISELDNNIKTQQYDVNQFKIQVQDNQEKCNKQFSQLNEFNQKEAVQIDGLQKQLIHVQNQFNTTNEEIKNIQKQSVDELNLQINQQNDEFANDIQQLQEQLQELQQPYEQDMQLNKLNDSGDNEIIQTRQDLEVKLDKISKMSIYQRQQEIQNVLTDKRIDKSLIDQLLSNQDFVQRIQQMTVKKQNISKTIPVNGQMQNIEKQNSVQYQNSDIFEKRVSEDRNNVIKLPKLLKGTEALSMNDIQLPKQKQNNNQIKNNCLLSQVQQQIQQSVGVESDRQQKLYEIFNIKNQVIMPNRKSNEQNLPLQLLVNDSHSNGDTISDMYQKPNKRSIRQSLDNGSNQLQQITASKNISMIIPPEMHADELENDIIDIKTQLAQVANSVQLQIDRMNEEFELKVKYIVNIMIEQYGLGEVIDDNIVAQSQQLVTQQLGQIGLRYQNQTRESFAQSFMQSDQNQQNIAQSQQNNNNTNNLSSPRFNRNSNLQITQNWQLQAQNQQKSSIQTPAQQSSLQQMANHQIVSSQKSISAQEEFSNTAQELSQQQQSASVKQAVFSQFMQQSTSQTQLNSNTQNRIQLQSKLFTTNSLEDLAGLYKDKNDQRQEINQQQQQIFIQQQQQNTQQVSSAKLKNNKLMQQIFTQCKDEITEQLSIIDGNNKTKIKQIESQLEYVIGQITLLEDRMNSNMRESRIRSSSVNRSAKLVDKSVQSSQYQRPSGYVTYMVNSGIGTK